MAVPKKMANVHFTVIPCVPNTVNRYEEKPSTLENTLCMVGLSCKNVFEHFYERLSGFRVLKLCIKASVAILFSTVNWFRLHSFILPFMVKSKVTNITPPANSKAGRGSRGVGIASKAAALFPSLRVPFSEEGNPRRRK